MTLRAIMLCLGALPLIGSGHAESAEPTGHITGVGGVFFASRG